MTTAAQKPIKGDNMYPLKTQHNFLRDMSLFIRHPYATWRWLHLRCTTDLTSVLKHVYRLLQVFTIK